MARKHYHLFAGTVGCLPDGADADVYATKRDAESAAKAEAAVYREMGYRVTGNVATGYAIDPITYVEVVACTNPECVEEEEA